MTDGIGRWLAAAVILQAAGAAQAQVAAPPGPASARASVARPESTSGEQAGPVGQLTLLGDAAATAGDTSKGAAGIGLELVRGPLWISALIKAGAAGPLDTANPRDFWSLLLVPAGGSASVTLDVGYYLRAWHNAAGAKVFWLGARVQGTASKVVWTAAPGQVSGDINLFAFQGGAAARYDITADLGLPRPKYDVALTGGLAVAGRTFTGDTDFVFAHSPQAAPNFRGLQADFAIELNKIRAFVQLPMMRRSPAVPGITGTSLLIGIGVRGDLVTLP